MGATHQRWGAAMNPSWQRSAAFYEQLIGYGFSTCRGAREITAIQIVAAVASIRQVKDTVKILRVLQPVKGNSNTRGGKTELDAV